MKKTKKSFCITGILFLLFVVYTAMLSLIDVQPIGPEQSKVGFATLNRAVHGAFGVQLLWYHITNWLGVLTIAVALIFAVLGFIQLIRRKSLMKVNCQILLLGVFYLVVAASYLFFECIVINYRPILLNAELEVSYPSSHTMLVICIMATAMFEFHRLLSDKKLLCMALEISAGLLITLTIVGRLISGVHWFTDIVGGVLLSATLVMLYRSAVMWFEQRNIVED